MTHLCSDIKDSIFPDCTFLKDVASKSASDGPLAKAGNLLSSVLGINNHQYYYDMKTGSSRPKMKNKVRTALKIPTGKEQQFIHLLAETILIALLNPSWIIFPSSVLGVYFFFLKKI